MSTFLDEDIAVAPWVGPLSCENCISVIVLSQNLEILNKLAEALAEVHNKGDYGWELKVLRSLNFGDVLMQSELTGNIAIDFVIIAPDTGRSDCLEWAKKALNQVHPDLMSRRVVLVNTGVLYKMIISPGELLTFQDEYQLDLLTGNIMQPKDAVFLAGRLLNYLKVSIGVVTGIPNLNV